MNFYVTFIWKSALLQCTIQFPHFFRIIVPLRTLAKYRLFCLMVALSLASAGQNAPVTQTQPPVAGTTVQQAPASQHVFLIVLENGSYATVTNSTDATHFMPNLIGLGNTYGHATNYVTNSGGSLLLVT